MLSQLRFLWNMLGVVVSWLLSRLFGSVHALDSRRAELVSKRDAATTYAEWRRWAREVDDHDGYQSWRIDENSRLFAVDEVTARIRTLTDLRQRRDYVGLLAELSADFHRRMCGVTNPLLYSKYATGTKAAPRLFVALLERFIGELAAPDTPGVTLEHKIAALSDLARAYGHAALILNSSAAFGFFHLGIVKVLYESQVLPRVVFGRSSGAIAAAFLCCSENPVADALDPDKIDTSAFTKHEHAVSGATEAPNSNSGANKKSSFWRRVNRFFTEGVIMDVGVVMEFVRDNLGDVTFEEAYKRTGRVLNIYVQRHANGRDAGWLLNYLSAPNITVASAAVASIATPGVYAPVPLMQKTPHGTIVQCLPASLAWTSAVAAAAAHGDVSRAIARLRHLFNVNFFIVSEASGRHLPFLTLRGSRSFVGRAAHFVTEELWRLGAAVARLCRSRFAPLIEAMNEEPQGDVLLFPVTTLSEVLECLTNPSRAVLDRGRQKGETVIWPRLEEIKANMLLERALHDALVELQQQQQQHQQLQIGAAAGAVTSSSSSSSSAALIKRRQHLSEIQHHLSALEHFTF